MRIAVVGAGISGLTTALLLQRRHQVTLFESEARLGGHTNTIEVINAGKTYPVDTGFIVFNDRTYPLFERLLTKLDVPWQDSDMSFSVRCEITGLEYSGSSLNTLFAQRLNLLRPRFWGLLRDILRFNRTAPLLLERNDDDPTLAEYLAREKFGKPFIEQYLIPMGAAIWSADPNKFGNFSARFLIRFFVHHGLLSINDRPQWRVVCGGSQTYVRAIAARMNNAARSGIAVTRVTRSADSVAVHTADAKAEEFDHVILACHSDTALQLLGEYATRTERDVLGAIPYQSNTAVLHTDERLLPRKRLAWASWNYHRLPRESGPAAVTYWMNNLQRLDAPVNYLVTLNRRDDIDPTKIIHVVDYQHPVFTRAGVAAQARHAEINGAARVSFCGAYWRNGFHEDGVWSAWQTVRHLGLDPDSELNALD